MNKFNYQLLYVESANVNAIFVKSSEINNIELARLMWQKTLFEKLKQFAHGGGPDKQNRRYVHICEHQPCNSSDDW